jgi:hypothetical protein
MFSQISLIHLTFWMVKKQNRKVEKQNTELSKGGHTHFFVSLHIQILKFLGLFRNRKSADVSVRKSKF